MGSLVALVVESPATHTTTERLLPRVYKHVAIQLGFRWKNLAAVWAHLVCHWNEIENI